MKKNKEKRSGGGPRGCLRTMVVVMGLLLAFGIGGAYYLGGSLSEIFDFRQIGQTVEEKLPSLVLWVQGHLPGNKNEILNILVVGQDRREGENHSLSDTMIICSFDPKTRKLTMCSLMRDMYVELPPYEKYKGGMNRMNAAYAIGYNQNGTQGAMELLDKTILEQFGVEIDYNVELNFESFRTVMELVGGIDIELTGAEAKYLNKELNNSEKYNFSEGMAHLDGNAGLEYARMRHSDAGDSDFNRTRRQRTVISAVLSKAKGLGSGELLNLAKTIFPELETDMSWTDMLSCAGKVMPMLSGMETESVQIPADGTYTNQRVTLDGYPAAVLVPDVEKNREILTAICETGQTPEE